MWVVAIILARMGSSRFPGKVLADLAGKSLFAHAIAAAQKAQNIDQVVVATTEKSEDDLIVKSARSEGVETFRGSEEDVLDRFFRAAETFRANVAVRLTVDNPLVPPALIDQIVERHIITGADFTSNLLPSSFPDGLEVEAISFETLQYLHGHVHSSENREHVTWYIRTHPAFFRIENIWADEELKCIDMSLSIDTPEDLERVTKACRTLYETFRKRSMGQLSETKGTI